MTKLIIGLSLYIGQIENTLASLTVSEDTLVYKTWFLKTLLHSGA